MDNLFLILFVLLIVVAVGHFAWLGLAATLRLLMNGLRLELPANEVRKRFHDPELLELEVVSKTIRQLAVRGELDAETAERRCAVLEARRALCNRSRPSPFRER